MYTSTSTYLPQFFKKNYRNETTKFTVLKFLYVAESITFWFVNCFKYKIAEFRNFRTNNVRKKSLIEDVFKFLYLHVKLRTIMQAN